MGGVGINGVVGVNGGEWGLMGLICSDIFCKRVEGVSVEVSEGVSGEGSWE